MNRSNSKGSMSVSTWKSGEVVSGQFPVGLRVLVVDDDPTCLMIVETMLKACRYEVTTCNRAEKALASLQANRNGFDIVISDVHMPDMDGFKLLEHIGLEMDLPVIMMSMDDGKQVMMKGVNHGACDYLIKPIRMEELKNIWQHVVRKKKNEWKELEQSASVKDSRDQLYKQSEDADHSSSTNEGGNWKSSERRKDEEDEPVERHDTSTLKKPRVVWSVELHQQFVAAVNQLGIDKAVPKKILELMNVPDLTRENVASHLQKYRLYLRRLGRVSQYQGGVNTSFIGNQDATFRPISSLSGLDLQALASAGQLPGQSLTTLQAAGFPRPSPKSSLSIPMFDQKNMFSFDNSKFKIGGQQQQHNLGNSKQMNLLHGIPTTMEPKQLANLHQSFENLSNMQVLGSHGNSILMHRGPAQVPPSMGQPATLNGVPGGQFPRKMPAENGRGVGGYTNPDSQTTSSTALTSPMNHVIEILGTNSFHPLGSPPVIPSLTQKGPFQEDLTVNSDVKGSTSGGFIPSYYVLNDLQQIQSHDWDLQNAGLTFDSAKSVNPLHGSLESSASSSFVQQGIPRSGSMRNSSSGRGNRERFPVEGAHYQNLNIFVNNSMRVKSENVEDTGCLSTLYSNHFDQEDLMSALLKQQEGIGPLNPKFHFNGYSMDNMMQHCTCFVVLCFCVFLCFRIVFEFL